MMRVSNSAGALALAAMLATPMAGLAAQQAPAPEEYAATVIGEMPTDLSGLPEGPEVEGMITARQGGRMQVTGEDGTPTIVSVGPATQIKSSGGFLGLGGDKLAADALLNGLPVAVETVQFGGGLIASRIKLKSKDLRTASMIRGGTVQGFAEQTAATEALRGRLGDLDKYNLKGTTNVNFDTGQAVLSEQAKADLCAAAAQADAMDNAVLLVIGYTDSTGSEDFNQALSEKRASKVVNFLQQRCGWKPYRMLTPTGMAEADPLADNTTVEGKAQNRRVAVNILVSKSVDGL
jgi:outer membrane protein OmpA-like peptidoglycan-associated protein